MLHPRRSKIESPRRSLSQAVPDHAGSACVGSIPPKLESVASPPLSPRLPRLHDSGTFTRKKRQPETPRLQPKETAERPETPRQLSESSRQEAARVQLEGKELHSKSERRTAEASSDSAGYPGSVRADGRDKCQIPVGASIVRPCAARSRIASPQKRLSLSAEKGLPPLRPTAGTCEGMSAPSRLTKPSRDVGPMEPTQDSNFNQLPSHHRVSYPAMSPSPRKREAFVPDPSGPQQPSSSISSPRPRAGRSLNNNPESPRRQHPFPQPRDLNVQRGYNEPSVRGRLEGNRHVARGEETAEEATLDENVNPAGVVRRTSGKALIIMRAATTVTEAGSTRSIQAPLEGKGDFRDSEAGPEVALLPDEMLTPATAFFQDTAAVEALTSGVTSPSASHDSLLVRCDPRLARTGSQTPAAGKRHKHLSAQQDESVSVSEKRLSVKEDLIAFSPAEDSLKRRPVAPVEPSPAPPDVAQPAPDPAPDADPAPAPAPVKQVPQTPGQERKTQELMMQEKVLKRDREVQTLQETVSKLKQQLAASQAAQQRMAKVLERHTSALCQMAAARSRLESQQAQQVQLLKAERDEAREEVANIESMFADLHRKYEKSKSLLAENKQTSELVSAELEHAMSQVSREQQRYDMLQQYAEDTMQRLQSDMELEHKSQETENLRMSARLQLAENRALKLERENQEVTAICDELIGKMGGNR